MTQINLLLAEDDTHIREGLVDMLESEGYGVRAVKDGDEALTALERQRFDLVILDIMMPGTSGYDVCRSLRIKDAHTPVMMLTAKSEEIDKVVGLQLGADDYLSKPFGVHELLARVAALLRRARLNSSQPVESRTFSFGDFEIDPGQYRATSPERTVSLTARELKLLQLFHASPNLVLDRDHLLNGAWGQHYLGTTRTLDQHIAQLRKKIEPQPSKPRLILTVHGIGYRYQPDRETQ